MADEAAQLAQAKKLIVWLWFGIAVCVAILAIDLMLKRQLGRLAVEVATVGRSAAGAMAAPAHDPDLAGGDGGDRVAGDAALGADDGQPHLPVRDPADGAPGRAARR